MVDPSPPKVAADRSVEVPRREEAGCRIERSSSSLSPSPPLVLCRLDLHFRFRLLDAGQAPRRGGLRRGEVPKAGELVASFDRGDGGQQSGGGARSPGSIST